MDYAAHVEALMKGVSDEVELLRQSILERNSLEIEVHTQHMRDMLTDLRPLLIRQCPASPEFHRLRNTVRVTLVFISRVRQAVRALHQVYRSVLDPISGPGTYEARR